MRACEAQLALRTDLEKDQKNLLDEKARAEAENKVLQTEMNEMESRRKALRETSGAACPTCEKPLEPETGTSKKRMD